MLNSEVLDKRGKRRTDGKTNFCVIEDRLAAIIDFAAV